MATSSGNQQQGFQVRRWVFTLNNYDETYDYEAHISSIEHVKRAVWGFERSPESGMKHIQGYIEFNRSLRLQYMRTIFVRAFWAPARASAAQNYTYCTKSGTFNTIGDFTRERIGEGGKAKRPVPASTILRGLLQNRSIQIQVQVSHEYSNKFQYYSYMGPTLRTLRRKHEIFNTWQSKLLYMWQFKAMQILMHQTEREVLWICDPPGNSGKSFFAKYLHVLYNFCLLDGIIDSRDLTFMLEDGVSGAVFDLARPNAAKCDYSILEGIKMAI